MPGTDGDQGSLFTNANENKPTSPPGEPDGYYALSSNYSIGSLLARGCLLAPCHGEPTDIPFLDDTFPAHLAVSRGVLQPGWSEQVRSSRRNCFPIAVRYRPASKTDTKPTALALADVSGLVFESKKELERFRSLAFADYDVAKLELPLVESREIFPDRGESTDDHGGRGEEQPTAEPPGANLGTADSRAALLSVLITASPTNEDWAHAASLDTRLGAPSRWIAAIRRGLDGSEDGESELDDALLVAAAGLLATEFRSDRGWPASKFLDQLVEKTQQLHIAKSDPTKSTRLEDWVRRCHDILAGRKEPPALTDRGAIVMRALLLLLLRGDVAAVLGVETGRAAETELQVGENVRALGLCLASVRTGLRALPVELKCPSAEHPRRLLEFLGDSILRDLRVPRPGSESLSIRYRELGDLQGEWVFEWGRQELLRRSRRVDPGLVRVEAMGRELGYSMARHGEDAIRITVQGKGEDRRDVFLCLHQVGPRFERFLRIWAPALDLSNAGSRSTKWPTPALNKKPKSFLLDLLERNAHLQTSCRFAISSEEKAIVVMTDQLLATLDEGEFRHHVEHVAQVAGEFEAEHAGKRRNKVSTAAGRTESTKS